MNICPSIEYSNTMQFTDNLTKVLGKHSMKAGFEWQRLGLAHSATTRGTRSVYL